mgnify:CR=1 FL=1
MFARICEFHYRSHTRELIRAEYQSHGQSQATASKTLQRATNQKFRGKLTVSRRVYENDVEAILEDLASVNWFRFDYTMLHNQHPVFAPFDGILKKSHVSMQIEKAASRGMLREAIRLVCTKEGLANASVEGRDAGGEPRTRKIGTVPSVLAEWEYDDVATELRVQVAAFHESPLITRLLEVARTRPDLLQ